MKLILKSFLCFLFFSSLNQTAFSQDKTIVTKEPKFKPPVVKTSLGVNQNGAKVTSDEGSQLVGLPLKVVDTKNNQYTVGSYQFLYKEKSYIVDDETGKKETVFTIASDRFTTTPLPQVWINNIKNKLQSDEELYFFDIVVKDKEGRLFFAPELKITIK